MVKADLAIGVRKENFANFLKPFVSTFSPLISSFFLF